MEQSRPSSPLLTALPRFLIRLYQVGFAGRPRRCRFEPTCSQFMYEALATQGLFHGLRAGLWRLLKCHPWHPGGYDPVHS